MNKTKKSRYGLWGQSNQGLFVQQLPFQSDLSFLTPILVQCIQVNSISVYYSTAAGIVAIDKTRAVLYMGLFYTANKTCFIRRLVA